MVLGRDIAKCGSQVDTGLVHAAITKLHLIGGGTSGQPQKLMAHADTEDRARAFQSLANVRHGRSHHLRVTGTIRQEDTYELFGDDDGDAVSDVNGHQ